MRKWLLVILGLLLMLVGGGCAAFLLFSRHYDSNVERFPDPFADLNEAARPPVPKHDQAMTILVLGSDSRISAGNPGAWAVGAQRTDAIMLMHIPADRSSVQLVSIPRDAWVAIPEHGYGKINAAFSWGGPSLLVSTVEQLTDVRINHVAIADFTSFTDLTDALGGVQIAGQEMNGAQSLEFVRQRHGLAGGDLDRVQRQQAWIVAVAEKMSSKKIVTHPVRLNRVMNTLTQSLSVDERFTGGKMRSLARSMRKLSGADIRTDTAPVKGSGRESHQAVLYLDTTKAQGVWARMRS